jgi:hypothetical protein
MTWRDNEFKIGINMAGAVSAGAYTAGVLDFLMEALEQWQLHKEALRRYLSDPVGPVPLLVPLHDVTIEVFAGASAGRAGRGRTARRYSLISVACSLGRVRVDLRFGRVPSN